MDGSGLVIRSDAIYTQRALRQQLGISPATFARARRDGELPFVQKGKTFLYRGDALLAWLSPAPSESPAAREPANAG